MKTYLIAATAAAAAVSATHMRLPRADVAMDYAVSLSLFEPLAFSQIALLGLLMAGARPQATLAGKLVRWLHGKTIDAYATAAGGIAGWALAESTIHVLKTGVGSLAVASFVALLTLGLTALPLYLLGQVKPIFDQASGFLIARPRGLPVLNACGYGTVLIAAAGLGSWFASTGISA